MNLTVMVSVNPKTIIEGNNKKTLMINVMRVCKFLIQSDTTPLKSIFNYNRVETIKLKTWQK